MNIDHGGTLDAMRERLIEHGFPCHQMGVETQCARGMSTALPAHLRPPCQVGSSAMGRWGIPVKPGMS
jgi:hypothetical protein